MIKRYICLVFCMIWAISGRGASIAKGPGEILTLNANWILANSDTVDLVGTVQNPCIIQGNSFGFLTNDASWVGHLTIQNCTISGLGAATVPAISAYMQNGYINVSGV